MTTSTVSFRTGMATLAIMVAGALPARAERLTDSLREAHLARIGLGGRTFVLVRPRPAFDGLAYDHLDGGRPAIIVDSSWQNDAPPNPIPWSSIDRVEAGYRSRRPGMMTGLTVGLLAGVLIGGYMAAFSEMEAQGSGPRVAVSITAIGALAGMGIGALFPKTTWVDVPPGAQWSAP